MSPGKSAVRKLNLSELVIGGVKLFENVAHTRLADGEDAEQGQQKRATHNAG